MKDGVNRVRPIRACLRYFANAYNKKLQCVMYTNYIA